MTSKPIFETPTYALVVAWTTPEYVHLEVERRDLKRYVVDHIYGYREPLPARRRGLLERVVDFFFRAVPFNALRDAERLSIYDAIQQGIALTRRRTEEDIEHAARQREMDALVSATVEIEREMGTPWPTS